MRDSCVFCSGGTRSASVDQNLTMTLFAISVTYVLLMLPDVIVHWLDAINVFNDMNKFEDYRIPAQALSMMNTCVSNANSKYKHPFLV